MAVSTAVDGSYIPSKFRHHFSPPPKITSQIRPPLQPPPPLFISTNRADVDHHRLKDLYTACNHSCHRFPAVDPAGKVEPVDINKLRTAISHSSIVVSVFTNPEFVSAEYSSSPEDSVVVIGGKWIRRVMPVTPENGQLVGFGRVVTDVGLTAAIYDVMVLPALQGRGIGRMIVKRIVRMLTNREIYDIAAICSPKERLFFEVCGFGDDILGSTTMMYMRTSPSCSTDENTVSIGRKRLLIPSPREHLQS